MFGPRIAKHLPTSLFAAGLTATTLLVAGATAGEKPATPPRVAAPLAEARRLIRMMDDIYQAGVLSAHKLYVHDPGTPSAVAWGKQVIGRVAGKGWPQAHIFASHDRPLNPDNSIADSFEREAVAAFNQRKGTFERIEKGELRYASEIRIVDRSCLVCHVKSKEGDLVGGVSYRIPIAPEKAGVSQR